jgi:hypothetical protein
MEISDITRITNDIVPLSPRLWAWASLLGGARTASNDERRHHRSDRGGSNDQVDLLGALGELFLLGAVMDAADSAEAAEYMRGHLYSSAGGADVKGPDLAFAASDVGARYAIDVKTFDCSPNKRFFAINANKHRSLAGQCTHYFCIAVPRYGRRMAVARLIPYADVETWPEVRLRSGGSPSRNCPLRDFLSGYFTHIPNLETIRADVYPPEEIEAHKRDPAVRSGLLMLVPSLAA